MFIIIKKDFSKFPIPFVCVATDLEKGKAVTIKKGLLPDAMRASMSIPSVFDPVELDGKILVDGMVVRNLPVSDVKKMGADIIIGVDVGAPLFDKKGLDSFIKVMDQTSSFMGAESTKKERKLCNVLITPDMTGLDPSSFGEAKLLIKTGRRSSNEGSKGN